MAVPLASHHCIPRRSTGGSAIFDFSITLTDQHARLATICYLKRKFGIVGFVSLLLLVGFFFATIVNRPGSSAVLGIGMAVVAAIALIPLAYFGQLKQTRLLMAQLGEPAIVEYRVDQQLLTTRSALGDVPVQWGQLERLWTSHDIWLLFFDDAGYLILPVAQVPAAARTLILNRLAAVGASIR